MLRRVFWGFLELSPQASLTASPSTRSSGRRGLCLPLRLRDFFHRDDEVTRLKTALTSAEKERDEALSKRDELADLRQKQRSEREVILASARETSEIYKSEVERLKKTSRELQAVNEDHVIHMSKAQKMLKGYYDKSYGMEAQIEELHRALDTSIEKLKQSEEYRTLLKCDTATLLRNFCQKLAFDFPGMSSHFTNFVTPLGEDYMVSLFYELPEEEPADNDDSVSDASEDETGYES
ncbi:hypothetical protein LIER_01636 [Lithospermum erythrorhizon]|uniref:Uncharacterized protein n=1 Tax=Lithospermum erythrorhizon TaxID=34254 RepID=A0AAV3NQA5_LITER